MPDKGVFITTDIDEYTVIIRPKWSAGGYGQVYKAQDNKTGEWCAVKEIDFTIDGTLNAKLRTKTQKELKVLGQLQKHTNIVQLLDVKLYHNSCWIFMELCDLRNLKCYLLGNPDITLIAKMNIMKQCAGAIAFMHAQEDFIIHRDIKLENILMKKETNADVVKIGDFGLSKIRHRINTVSKIKTRCGTRHYKAPEIFAGESYDQSVDVFALGLVFLVLIEFNESHQLTIPLSVAAKQNQRTDSYIGAEMLRCHREHQSMPDIFEIKSTHNIMQSITHLITSMTHFDSSKRERMDQIVNQLSALISTASIEADKRADTASGTLPPDVKTSSDDSVCCWTRLRKENSYSGSSLSGYSGQRTVYLRKHKRSTGQTKNVPKTIDSSGSSRGAILTIKMVTFSLVFVCAAVFLATLYSYSQIYWELVAASPASISLIQTVQGDIKYINRSQWGALPPRGESGNLTHPLKFVIVEYTVEDGQFNTIEACSRCMKNQQLHYQGIGWDDIAYNILVCNNSIIYEGRGWHTVSATALGWNFKSIGIAFIGDYVDYAPSRLAVEKLHSFFDYMVSNGVLTSDFTIYILGQVRHPFAGQLNSALYQDMKSWRASKNYSWSWKEKLDM